MTSQKRAGSRLVPKIYSRIESLIIRGRNQTPRQILTQLKAELPSGLKYARLPSVKTVERIKNELRIPEDTEYWDSALYSSSDTRLIMEMLPQLAALTRGATCSLTASEAASILRVRKAAPDMGALLVWHVSLMYLGHKRNEWPVHRIDMFLALAPWRKDEPWRRAAYENMLTAGGITVNFLDLLETHEHSDPSLVNVFCPETVIKNYLEGKYGWYPGQPLEYR